jgi:hypothetical protein
MEFASNRMQESDCNVCVDGLPEALNIVSKERYHTSKASKFLQDGGWPTKLANVVPCELASCSRLEVSMC